MRMGIMPMITRLNDPGKTALSAAFKPDTGLKAQIGAALKWYLRTIKGFDFPVLHDDHAYEKLRYLPSTTPGVRLCFQTPRRCLGEGPGRSFQEAKI